jgi:predicted DNA-binding transcriptional regulator AlpA
MQAPTTIHQEKLLAAGQVAEILGIKEATLAQKRWRGDHSLPYIKLGRVIRYKLSDVQLYIEQSTVLSKEA